MTNAAALLKPQWPVAQTKEQMLQTWLDLRKVLEDTKALEAAARKAVVEAFPFDAEIQEGTQNIDLANGYKLKVAKKLNYKLDNDAVEAALDKIEATGAEGKFIAERLVKFKAELSITEYRTLDNKYRGIIDDVLTVTPGLPTLELVEPKAKK